ncbi:restriction endonuclease subunit S [Microbispora sp. H10885]|uniref:restriction endonuclease subunit S n=1 Tax=Microbispora sp. H10885 TaxID=2729110 RepID=UPI001600F0B0|nr:restriction endonuclease subunit S [Microbispora sp. H10885]
MVMSLVGELPSGWRQAPLKEVCELRAGAGVSVTAKGTVPLLKPRNVADGWLTEEPDGISEVAAASLSRYRLAVGDVVCVRVGGIGRHAMVSGEQDGWIFGNGIIRLRPGDAVDPSYLNHYMSHPGVQDWMERNAAGTAIPSLSMNTLATMPVALPPLETQRSIGQVLDALNEKIRVHERIRRTTAQLRDAVLPLLMPGVTSVPGQ